VCVCSVRVGPSANGPCPYRPPLSSIFLDGRAGGFWCHKGGRALGGGQRQGYCLFHPCATRSKAQARARARIRNECGAHVFLCLAAPGLQFSTGKRCELRGRESVERLARLDAFFRREVLFSRLEIAQTKAPRKQSPSFVASTEDHDRWRRPRRPDNNGSAVWERRRRRRLRLLLRPLALFLHRGRQTKTCSGSIRKRGNGARKGSSCVACWADSIFNPRMSSPHSASPRAESRPPQLRWHANAS